MRSTRLSSCGGPSRGACCCGGYSCCGGGGPCAIAATHKTLPIALAHRKAFIDMELIVLSPASPSAAPPATPIEPDARPPIIRVTIPISIRIRVGVRIRIVRAVIRSAGRSGAILHIIRPLVIVRTHPAESLRRRLGGNRYRSFHPERQNLLRIKIGRPAPCHQHPHDSNESARAGADRRASAPTGCSADHRASRGSRDRKS